MRRSTRNSTFAGLMGMSAVIGMALGHLARFSLLAPPPASAHPAIPTPAPTPLVPSATQILLPAIGPLTADPACRTWIEVQAAGDMPSQVVLVTWGASSSCPLDASPGPVSVACSGLIAPGAEWVFRAGETIGPRDPSWSRTYFSDRSRSGVLFSFTARGINDIIDLDLAMCDSMADLMCEELYFGVVGDAEEYALFKQRYDTGGQFRGIPQDRAAGAPITAQVRRECPGSGGVLRAAYAGVPGSALDQRDSATAPYTYGLPNLVAASGGRSSQVHIQNAGSACGRVDIVFRATGSPDGAGGVDCAAPPVRCASVDIVPGESVRVDVGRACAVASGNGVLALASTAPLALVVDTPAGGVATHSTSVLADPVLIAPLFVDTVGGWRARVHLYDSGDVGATAVATLQDARGGAIATRDIAICARGGATWDIDLPPGTAGAFVGSVHVESREVSTVDGPVVPRLVGAVELTHVGSDGRADGLAEYALVPAGGAGIDAAPVGRPADSADVDVGAVIVPSLATAADGSGATSVLVVVNAVLAAGQTDVGVMLLDGNGVLDHRCVTLAAGEARAFDLRDWAGLAPGFVGGAVVSATVWNHPTTGQGGASRNPVGLAAMALALGTGGGSVIAGDLMASEGTGLAPGRITGLAHEGLVFFPGCPGGPRLVAPTPEPSPTPTASPPPPVLDQRAFLPLVRTVRVRR